MLISVLKFVTVFTFLLVFCISRIYLLVIYTRNIYTYYIYEKCKYFKIMYFSA